MRTFLTVALTKCVIKVSEHFKRGSTYPGKFARTLNKNITKKVKLPKLVIAVTGSSGKGSTSKMIALAYKKLGYSVAYNDRGSNVSDAVLTSIIKNANLFGKVKKDVAIFEVDERYAKYIFPYINPNYVVITNITRDQPPRQGHYDIVFNEIKKALKPSMHLILNSDDPYLYKFNDPEYKITYYGIDNYRYGKKKNDFHSLNMVYCPICGEKLKYEKYFIENLGLFKCSKCSFKRKKPTYELTKMNYVNRFMTINDTHVIYIKNTMLYNLYNTLAAYTTCALNGLDELKVCQILSNMKNNREVYNERFYKRRKIFILNNKNENSSTFNQSMNYIYRHKGLKTIVIGWNEISRRYKFNDLSWLYDIDFESLTHNKVDKIICVGTNQYDIATRIKQTGINQKKIFCFDNLELAKETILNNSKGNIFAVLNFDYLEPFNKILGGDSNGN